MPGENLPRRVWNRQTKFTYNHWLAALVKGKCTSTKPTRLATGVVCHPDTEQNRPYKIPWSYRGLNRGPTAPQARTLPVCHTTTNVPKLHPRNGGTAQTFTHSKKIPVLIQVNDELKSAISLWWFHYHWIWLSGLSIACELKRCPVLLFKIEVSFVMLGICTPQVYI